MAIPGEVEGDGRRDGGGKPAQGAEVELGCPAATPMMVAAWQVQEVIKLLTGQGSILRHQLLFMDAEMATVDLLSVG